MDKGKELPFLVFGAPDIREPDIAEVVDSLRTGWLGTGPKVARFESDFAAYKGLLPEQVAATHSCTAALHLSLLAAGIGPGDEVVTSALTFCATVNAIIHTGATPVLADVDPVTMNLDPREVEARITERTRALLPVHMAGRPCDMDALMKTAERHRLLVVEDCAHAVEAEYGGRKTGTFGDFGCFSFYATKNVVTGEGGMIVGRDEERVGRTRVLALHGMSKDAWHRFGDKGYKHYYVTEAGFKYNMMDLQAALGIHQLARVEENWILRRRIWDRYMTALAELPIGLPAPPEAGTRHAFHLFTVFVDERESGVSRDGFLDRMNERRVGTGVHYLSVPEHPYYRQRFGWHPEQWPEAARIGRQTVSLPLSPKLKENDVDRVVDAVRDCVG